MEAELDYAGDNNQEGQGNKCANFTLSQIKKTLSPGIFGKLVNCTNLFYLFFFVENSINQILI